MRERLIELLENFTYVCPKVCDKDISCNLCKKEKLANYLILSGVIVAPMPMADWLREELTEYVHQRCVDEL